MAIDSAKQTFRRQTGARHHSGRLRAIYILSLPHSGSTLLGHHLGFLPQTICLGEVGYTIERLQQRAGNESTVPCSCGKTAAECDFWSPLSGKLDFSPGPAFTASYDLVFDRFRSHYGPGAILCDTNKTSEPFAHMAASPDLEVSAIHLVRDFRGAIVSEALRKTKRRPGRPQWLSGISAGYQWMRRNLALSRLANSLPAGRTLQCSYEKFCSDPWGELERIASWMQIPPPERTPCRRPETHMVIGNTFGFSNGSREVRYDTRWRQNRCWVPAAILFPALPVLNRRWVYS